VGEVTALPRIKLYFELGGDLRATGWLMDFKAEREHHLGTIGGDEPSNHSFIYAHEELGFPVGSEVALTLLQKNLLNALGTAVEKEKVQTPNKNEVMREINKLMEKDLNLTGKFRVREVFDTSSGKFGIGQVNNYVYLDIRWALQQIINQTYSRLGLGTDSSPLVSLVNSPKFEFGQFATEATINL
jgi:hypothetical protein